MQIVIQIRTVYGNTAFYPICDKAKLFATIAGTKTLTATVLSNVAALGIEVVLDNGNIKQQYNEALSSLSRV
jgi:hypothetical protein